MFCFFLLVLIILIYHQVVFVHVHVDIDKDNDCIRSIMMSLQMICGNFFNLGFFIESLITVVTDFRLFVVLVISRLLFFTERN